MGLKLAPAVLAKVLAAEARPRATVGSGRPPAPPRMPPGGADLLPGDDRPPAWRLVIGIPGLVVVSEANRRDHWATRHRRAAAQRELVLAALCGVPVPAGRVRVAFVRRGGRRMDGDNLAGAFKACRDAVAAWLACDDGDDERAAWGYHQRPAGRPATCAIVVRPG